MSHSTESVLDRLARKWRDWSRRRRTMMALDCCDPAEMTRMAHDIGVSETDFRVLAGGGRARPTCCLSGCTRSISMPAKSLAPSRASPGICKECAACAQAGKDAGTISRVIPPRPRGGNIARMPRRLRR
jgi:hypothetical protein